VVDRDARQGNSGVDRRQSTVVVAWHVESPARRRMPSEVKAELWRAVGLLAARLGQQLLEMLPVLPAAVFNGEMLEHVLS
jgi:hypothetical protein